MNYLNYLAGLVIACVATPGLSAKLSPKVPKQFVGSWNADVKYCGKGESQLDIRAHDIEFYESSGPIKAIVVQGSDEVALIAELKGEEEKPYLTVRHFRLSEDQKQLSDVSSHPPYVRHRCP